MRAILALNSRSVSKRDKLESASITETFWSANAERFLAISSGVISAKSSAPAMRACAIHEAATVFVSCPDTRSQEASKDTMTKAASVTATTRRHIRFLIGGPACSASAQPLSHFIELQRDQAKRASP